MPQEAGRADQSEVLSFWQAYKAPIILGSVSIFLIVASVTLLIKSFQTAAPIEFLSSPTEEQESSLNTRQAITVDVEGAVVKPGIYQLPLGARVEEAIFSAGGLSQEADKELIAKTINRAARLTDGMKLYLAKKGDAAVISSSAGTSGTGSVSINNASQNQLEALSGIGPVTAKKIIDNRPYGALEELISKKALSRSLFEKLKEQLTL